MAITKKHLREWADWEDIRNELIELRQYWEHQPPTTEQKQNVVSIKETIRLVEELL